MSRLSVWGKGEKNREESWGRETENLFTGYPFLDMPVLLSLPMLHVILVVYQLQKVTGKSDGEVNTTWLFGSFQRKISGSNGKSEKVILLFPNGSSCVISSKPFLFQALASFFREMGLICTNGKSDSRTKYTSFEFCLSFAQTVNRPVCPCKWLNKYYI